MKELIVPICVLFVLATLLLPIPAAFLDFLLVANIVLALLLLISTLYVSNPIKLSALPSILLLTTMYRLALNVSTTRRILSGGNPGQMIEAFGTVVVNGNLLVGLIVFLVITLVQFIVIAKGSERVAEVAARFTLDALPGKQMSIDADMRSGVIDVEDARNKRQSIQLESRFYGALDGSMKFVKGDAIAGIVITAINLIGGIVMGAVMLDLEVAASIERFSLYTVGDGLLSQMPALLNSLAAGMIVTRVTSEETKTNLAHDLLTQLGQVRVVKILIACLAVLLSFAPGMPMFPFWVLASILAVSSVMDASEDAVAGVQDGAAQVFSPKLPGVLSITLRREAVAALPEPAIIARRIDGVRQETFDASGLLLAPPQVQFSDSLKEDFEISLRDVPCSLSGQSDNTSCELPDRLSAALQAVIAERPALFVDDIMTRRLLDYYEEIASEQVAFVVPDLVSVTTITAVLRQLVEERVTIRPFDLIMQAIAEHGGGKDVAALLIPARKALGRHICAALGFLEQERELFQVDPMLDMAVMNLETTNKALDPTLLNQLMSEVSALPDQSIMLCSARSRRFLQECCKARGLNRICLSVDELCEDARFTLAGVLGSEAYADMDVETARERLVA